MITPRARLFAVILGGFLVGSFTATASPAAGKNGWDELIMLDSAGARKIFARTQDRESRYGQALAQINLQPRTAANLTAARSDFTALIAANPADDIGIAAAYYLVRLRQIDESDAEPQALIHAYQALLQAHPGHPIAELAAPKLAILLLYDAGDASTWAQRVAAVEALLPGLQSTAARRDTRLVLADALLKLHRDHARAFPLLDYCLRANLIARPPRLGALLLQAAESARLLHLTPEAIHYYRRYLAEYPREAKADEIKRRLAALATEGRL